MAGTDAGIIERLGRADAAVALVHHAQDRTLLRWRSCDLQAARQYAVTQLRAAGLRRGAALLVLCGDLPQFVALFLAALDLGLRLLPLHPDQDARTLQAIVASQRPAALVAVPASRAALEQLRRHIPCCFVLEPAARDWLRRLPTLTASEAPSPLPAAAADAGVVFHSSGSTGLPKAVYYDRARLETYLQLQRRLYQPFDDEAPGAAPAAPTPRIGALPLTHWGGLSFCLQALLEGRAVQLQEQFDADALLQLVARSGCRLLFLVPGMYRELLPRLERQCPPSLRYCITMGEAMPAALAASLRQRHGLLLCTAYGMSEALSGLAHGGVPWEDMPHGSCGQQAFGELQLVAPDGQVQPATGEAEGELWVRNATTAACYDDATLLREKFVDGWYRSGDCLRRDAAGHYFFLTRLDAMCVHNGRNVYPQQLEAVFIEHPAVVACVAAPLQLRDGRRRLGVGVVLQPGAALAPHALLDFYLQHGAHYAAPAFLLLLDSLPLTPGGKPDRARVAALLQQACDRATSPHTARHAAELSQ